MKWDPRLCTLVVNGRYIASWLSLTGGFDNDRIAGFDSADGKVFVGLNPSPLGHFDLVLAQVNGHTAYLENLARADSPFPVVLIDRSDSARSARGSRCWVKKTPDMERARGHEPKDEPWSFVVEDFAFGYQGGPDDDVAAMPTEPAQGTT